MGNQIHLPKPQGLIRGPPRPRMWPLRAAPLSYPPECRGPQGDQGGRQLRIRSPCFKPKALAIPCPPGRTLLYSWTEDHSSGLQGGPGYNTADAQRGVRLGWGCVPQREVLSGGVRLPAGADTGKGHLGPQWTRTGQVQWALHALELCRAPFSKGQGPCSPPVEGGPQALLTWMFSLGPRHMGAPELRSLPTSQLQKFQASSQRLSLAKTLA